MSEQGPYSRVYHRLQVEYRAVFDDETALGTWLRLLVIADATYPSPAHLPRRCNSRALAKLVEAGLVTVDDDLYTVRGLTGERERRSAQGRAGGRAFRERLTNAQRTPDERQPSARPRRDETRKDETSIGSNDPRPISEILPDLAAKFAKPS